MAKIKKRKLRWEASISPQVVGYKLYWAVDDAVHYGSESIVVGNVTELVLPDDILDFRPSDGPVTFAIAALDEVGNESDLITLTAPYQFSAPQAPEDFWMEPEKAYHTSDAAEEAAPQKPEPIPLFERRLQQLEEELDAEVAKVPMVARGSAKHLRQGKRG